VSEECRKNESNYIRKQVIRGIYRLKTDEKGNGENYIIRGFIISW
jgi:hypothetical protein